MRVIVFQYSGRVGHFLRAEASRSAVTYPVPPRTVLLGLLGAILGLSKDEPQVVLKDAHIAVSGKVPRTHWHSVKLRKDPPAALPYAIGVNTRFEKNTIPEKPALIRQEWLWQPSYTVYAALPEPYHDELYSRLRDRRWYFNPCMGLSEMMANVELVSDEMYTAIPLPLDMYQVSTVVPQRSGQLDTEAVFKQRLALQSLRMPQSVTTDRVFSHASYYVEQAGGSIPLKTGEAWRVNDKTVVFL